jgi:selenocysteine-specific elongation factor
MIVGTAGHIDHGKSALVRSLTGVATDRLPVEKARGITIDLGFAYSRLTGGQTLGFVDVPGHIDFIHNMLAGAAGIDFVLLVVAADDGPMPQTREHLQIIDLLGIGRGVVALSKCDLVSIERLAEVEVELRGLLDRTTLAAADIIPVSVVTGDGLGALDKSLHDAALNLPPRRLGGHFRLAVDRSFSLPGIGTVVTGTVFAGAVRVGDRLRVSPSGLAARVRAIHAQNTPVEQGHAGQRCALNLVGAGIDKDRVHRGDWVVDAALHAPTDRLDALIRLSASEARWLRHHTPVHVHLGAARVPARIALLNCERLLPGGEALAQITLDRPLGALNGDRIVFRDHSARRTLGGGTVLDPWPPQSGRRRPHRLAALASLADTNPQRAVLGLLSADPGWVDLHRFALARNLTAKAAAELWRACDIVSVEAGGSCFGFGCGNWQALLRAVRATLAAHHREVPDSPGLEQHRLRIALDRRLPVDVFSAAIAAMGREEGIQRDGPWLKLAGHAARLTPPDQRRWERIQPLLARAGFRPPRVRDVARALGVREDEVRQLLLRLARMGMLVEIALDHFYPPAAVHELAAAAHLLAADSRDGMITTAAFRDRIGIGRKLAMHILEFFDRTGITMREGDLRRIREDRLAMFGKIAPMSAG